MRSAVAALGLISLASLATAATVEPVISSSTGFRLYAAPSTSLKSGGDAGPTWYRIVGLHEGAAHEQAVAMHLATEGGGAEEEVGGEQQQLPDDEFSVDLVFYQNGSSPSSAVVRDVLPIGYPLSMVLKSTTVAVAQEEGEEDEEGGLKELDMTVSGQTTGLGVQLTEEGVPALMYNGVSGGWRLCARPAGLKNEEHLVVAWGAAEDEDEACEAVEFVVECAELPPLRQNSVGTHAGVVEVPCMENVLGA